MTSRKHPSVAFWATVVVVVVLVVYPLSMGPALYVSARLPDPEAGIEIVWPVYRPLDSLAKHSPRLRNLMRWYVSLWVFPDFVD